MKKLSLLKSFVLAGALAITATGCGSKQNYFKANPFDYETTYRSLRISGMGYTAEQYTTVKGQNSEGESAKNYVISDVKALVIPVDFTDYPIETTVPYGEEGFKEQLKKVMFGDGDDTDWYSLSSYYKSSSYGTCNVTGDVGPTWHTNAKSTEYAKTYGTSGSQKIAVAIQDYYREHSSEIDLTQYDANKDGYVDALIMIYTAPITTTGELWWAFCWNVGGAYGKYNPELEGINRFFWASYNFFYEKYDDTTKSTGYYTKEEIVNNNIKPDAHTMTHEFGHVLGLPDYYITDYNSSDYSGLGGLDMMDNNIGDHNAVSKSWYGWISPYVVTGSTTITIKSTTTTGDYIIVPIQGKYKNTLLDQYLAIEFITPEGVAKKDGDEKYLYVYPRYYTKAGIKVTLVDARLGLFSYNSSKSAYECSGFVSSISSGNQTYTGFACDNTANDSIYPGYKLLELLPANGKTMKAQRTANDSCLFMEGDTFGAKGTIYENYKVHGISGKYDTKLGFKFTIDAINGYDSATISFKKI